MPNNILSIIIPIYNEDHIVADSLPPIFSLDVPKEVIVVDDGSTDETGKILRSLQAHYNFRLITQSNNRGKGAAVRCGALAAQGEYLTIFDADAEYRPEDVARLLAEIKKQPDGLTAIYGSRFLGKRDFSLHTLVNRFLSSFTNILFGSRLTDMETCLKMIPRGLWRSLDLRADRFDIEPEITAEIIKRGGKIKELPISYSYRGYDQGKKIRPKDGWQAMKKLISERFRR